MCMVPSQVAVQIYINFYINSYGLMEVLYASLVGNYKGIVS